MSTIAHGQTKPFTRFDSFNSHNAGLSPIEESFGFHNAEIVIDDEVEFAATVELIPANIKATIIVGSTEIFPPNYEYQRCGLGGVRITTFDSTDSQLEENKRLSGSQVSLDGMTAKNAFVSLLNPDLVMGGAKATIDANKSDFSKLEWQKLMKSFGAFQAAFNSLSEAAYISAEDMNCSGQDMVAIRDGLISFAKAHGFNETRYAKFASLLPESEGGYGEPSPYTAQGVTVSIETAADYFDLPLSEAHVLVHGCGNVGSLLVKNLLAKTRVYASDPNPDLLKAHSNLLNLKSYAEQIAYCFFRMLEPTGNMPSLEGVPIDIFSPCARQYSSYHNNRKLFGPELRVIAGAENNQFLFPYVDAASWKSNGITCMQDFATNFGGVTLAIAEYHGIPKEAVEGTIDSASAVLREQLEEMKKTGLTHLQVLEKVLPSTLNR